MKSMLGMAKLRSTMFEVLNMQFSHEKNGEEEWKEDGYSAKHAQTSKKEKKHGKKRVV